MDLGCQCICSWDGDPADFYKIEMPKARKRHTCCECGEDIQPGEKYEKATGLWDGCWETYKTCWPCVLIRNDVCCGGLLFGQLRETIWEAVGLDYVTGRTVEDEEDEG